MSRTHFFGEGDARLYAELSRQSDAALYAELRKYCGGEGGKPGPCPAGGGADAPHPSDAKAAGEYVGRLADDAVAQMRSSLRPSTRFRGRKEIDPEVSRRVDQAVNDHFDHLERTATPEQGHAIAQQVMGNARPEFGGKTGLAAARLYVQNRLGSFRRTYMG